MKKTATMWLLILLCAGIGLAQSTKGSGGVGGRVVDNNGEGLPDTDVVIENQSMALERTAGTSDDGVFQAPGLIAAPGYKLKITRKSFQPWESAEFTVPVGQTVNFDIRLQAAAGTGQASTAAVYTSEGDRFGNASVYGADHIESLPLMQQRIDPLVPLASLVTTDATGQQISILGQPFPPVFLTDGMLTRDDWFTQKPLSDLTPLNAIEGFEVLTADAPTEFGYSSSGIVNAATRSGTNSYHGDVYGFLRIPSMTAVGRYADGHTLLGDRNQSGADFGGPIRSGKLFFFANFEAINDHFSGVNRVTTQLIANSSASAVAPSNCTAAAAACTAAEKFIQSQMNAVVPLSMRSIDGMARIDYRLSARNSMSFAGNLTNSLAPDYSLVANAAINGGLIGIRNTRNDSRYANVGVTTSLFASTTNEFHIGESQYHIFNPSSIPTTSLGDIGVRVAGTTLGDPNQSSSLITERRYQLADNYTAPLESHTFQLGFDGYTTRYVINSLDIAPTFDFASLTAFATDFSSTTGKDYSLLTQGLGEPVRHFPMGHYSVYAQDTWRASPRLSIMVGLRWDVPMVPQPGATNTAFYETGSIPKAKLELSPRAGIAYRVNDRTVVRLGYGFFYEPFSGQIMDSLLQGNGMLQANLAISPTLTGAPAFPVGIPENTAISSPSSSVGTSLPVCSYGVCTVTTTTSGGTTIPAGSEELAFSTNKLQDPHTQQISLTGDRRLGSRTTLSLSVVDVRSFRLIAATDYNANTPTSNIAYTIENTAGVATGTTVTPVFTSTGNSIYSHVYQIGNSGTGRYDAASLELRRSMARGLMFQGSYTWSHAFDNLSGPLIGAGVPFVETNTSAFTPNRAGSLFDQRQRLVANATWQPTLASKSPFARYFANGWQISPILTLATGHPVTATVAADELTFSGVTPLYANTIDGYGGTTRVPFLPVDAYKTGTERNLDVRIAKSFPITERVRATFMFDVFNALNSQWNTGLDTVAYQAGNGVIRAVSGAGSGAAAVAYPYQTNARSAQVAFKVIF